MVHDKTQPEPWLCEGHPVSAAMDLSKGARWGGMNTLPESGPGGKGHENPLREVSGNRCRGEDPQGVISPQASQSSRSSTARVHNRGERGREGKGAVPAFG